MRQSEPQTVVEDGKINPPAVWPPPPRLRPPVAAPRPQRQLWPLGGLLIAFGSNLLHSQVDPAVYWGRLEWPEAAIPCLALLVGLPWSACDVVRSAMRGHKAGMVVGVFAGLLNLYVGLCVILLRPK